MNRELKIFRRDLPAIRANAEDGDSTASLHIIRYIKEMVRNGEPTEVEATIYLILSLSKLSYSEMGRLAKALGIDIEKITTSEFITRVPSITESSIRWLSKKLTSKMERQDILKLESKDITIERVYVRQGKTNKRQLFSMTPKLERVIKLAKCVNRKAKNLKYLFTKYPRPADYDNGVQFSLASVARANGPN